LFAFNELENPIWGFREYQGRLYIDNLKVYRQMLPQLVDITRIAEVMVQGGDTAGALSHLLTVARNYEDRELVEKAVSKIMNIGSIGQRGKVYKAVLSDDELMDKLFFKINKGLGNDFLKEAFNYLALQEGALTKAVEKYAKSLGPDDAFSFYVYLGLLFNSKGDIEAAKSAFSRALAIKDDPVVRDYKTMGVSASPGKRAGAMVLVPQGYLPYKFGKSLFVKAFYMDTTEVTQKMHQEVTGKNPAYFNGKTKMHGDVGVELNRPVEMVTFWDAILFCNKRSKLEGRDTCYVITRIKDTIYNYTDWKGAMKTTIVEAECDPSKNGYRLPFESEFEYALRANSTEEYFWGADTAPAKEYAWYKDNSGNMTHVVAQKKPNGFGLYDINGNVNEWCQDKLDKEGRRVLRGGTYGGAVEILRASERNLNTPDYRGYDYGFRCVCSAP
jgi:tetratricopeptide (TPR) repeat protein